MLNVGSLAPSFDGSAVVAGRLVRLAWRQLHDNKTLVLLFDSLDGRSHRLQELIAAGNAVIESARPRARLAVVCRNDIDELLAQARPEPPSFPLIVDPDGRIAALYGLPEGGRATVWGQFLIDSSGVIRQAAQSGFPLCPGVEELLRDIGASGYPAETDLRN